ncbi:MAG TPA: hypothetical protein VGP93_07540 [Polyangiaceae bacterium]|nr:hypothetical protein [Polyangiaceae bacterium]
MIDRELFATHPQRSANPEALRSCVEACFAGAAACSACADACLAERDVASLVGCIRACLDCSDLCVATARMLSRQIESNPQLVSSQIDVCRIACLICSQEALLHAQAHEHCRLCSEACFRCDVACGRLAKVLREV